MGDDKEINVKDWINLSSVMIGAVLTILALIWQVPIKGVISVTYLLILSFIFFVNSVSTNSKANFEKRQGNITNQKLNRWMLFAEYTFGIGFTCVICAFAILGYEYLIDYGGVRLLSLFLPITFIVVALILMFTYNIINFDGKLSAFMSIKRNLWAILEVACLVIIVIDYISRFTTGLALIP
jgi:hypothetical protein